MVDEDRLKTDCLGKLNHKRLEPQRFIEGLDKFPKSLVENNNVSSPRCSLEYNYSKGDEKKEEGEAFNKGKTKGSVIEKNFF